MTAPLRVCLRRILLLAVSVATVACSSTPVVTTERGIRSCDRNGDYEQRMACSP